MTLLNVLLFAFCVLLCAYHYQGLPHDTIIGECFNRNRTSPVISKVVYKPNNKFFRSFRKTNLTLRLPEKFEFDKPITCISIKDNATDGRGGFARVMDGGINFRYVVLDFKSQSGGDIRFTVDIYTDPMGSVKPVYPNIQSPPIGWVQPPNSHQPPAYQPPGSHQPHGYQPPGSHQPPGYQPPYPYGKLE
ncbi:hypothetical protein Bhyg_04326 [Pseudolycoriella hygida]|uniref:Uncharacterized protein n=1 Tax=Pseudolycoriella hygida TaxID=35572 RepID=A0A9Q0NF70_9DIPT|nr:hypothetical protein Bhyg_04326 [Pseudolycoriella hygida]